jgi:SAM-dependent methyltransferase
MTLRAIFRDAVASLPPALRWRARNAIALARWLRLQVAGDRSGAYADDFWSLHAAGDWNGLAGAVLHFCTPRSIVDVGCGDGKLLAALRARSAGTPLLGIDSAAPALARAAASGVPVHCHDLSSIRSGARAALRGRVAEFDVAVSLETAEHLPPWAASAFVEALSGARMIVFSAAQPGQHGTLHMNERPPGYWQAKFEARGFRRAVADAAFRDAVAALDLPWWYGANVHLFERRG